MSHRACDGYLEDRHNRRPLFARDWGNQITILQKPNSAFDQAVCGARNDLIGKRPQQTHRQPSKESPSKTIYLHAG